MTQKNRIAEIIPTNRDTEDFTAAHFQLIELLCKGAWDSGVKDEGVGNLLTSLKNIASKKLQAASKK